MSIFSSLDPQVRPWAEWFVDLLRQNGINPTITSTRRSRASQTRLYREYLAGRNPYPVAKPGTSRHEKGQAWDMVLPQYRDQVGQYWQSLMPGRTRWGGRKDPVHFEIRL